jgi:hypothetical protein
LALVVVALVRLALMAQQHLALPLVELVVWVLHHLSLAHQHITLAAVAAVVIAELL